VFESCHVWLMVSWLGYFALHSLLASLKVKNRVASAKPSLMPYYRLVFNLLALIFLVLPLALTFQCVAGPLLIQWSESWKWVSWLMIATAILLFAWTMKYYDGSEFLGLKQLKNKVESVEDQEQFHLSPVHRFVRHPWYLVGILIVWSRDMTMAELISSLMITLYFFLGSRLEEQKLMRYHGERYRQYCSLVPGIVPLPWKVLSKEKANELVNYQR